MLDWTPIVFVIFKVAVFCTAMYFAVKWHYDKEKGVQGKRAVLRACAKIAVVFVLSLLVLGLVTFIVFNMLGMEFAFS